jgi:hypothetical protein
MKSLIALVLVVAGLGMANVVEARGGHGHGGHGHGHPGHHHPGHRVGHHPHRHPHYHLGIRRPGWNRRVWSNTYNQYIYSDPAVSGDYYWSETDQLYFPVRLLTVPSTAVKVVVPR